MEPKLRFAMRKKTVSFIVSPDRLVRMLVSGSVFFVAEAFPSV
jgi:hypothetical protein